MSHNLSLVTFKIAKELYGIDIMDVIEIIRLCEITPIPNSPEFVDGVINLRGDIIPIVDLTKRFSFETRIFSEEEELLRGIIIIKVSDLRIGIIIDQVYRVLQVDKNDIQPPPQMISSIGTEYVQGVIRLEENDILLILLNIRKLFNQKELLMLVS